MPKPKVRSASVPKYDVTLYDVDAVEIGVEEAIGGSWHAVEQAYLPRTSDPLDPVHSFTMVPAP